MPSAPLTSLHCKVNCTCSTIFPANICILHCNPQLCISIRKKCTESQKNICTGLYCEVFTVMTMWTKQYKCKPHRVALMVTTNQTINQTSPPPPDRGLFRFQSRFVWNVEKDLFETFHSIPPSGVFAKRNGDGLTLRGLLPSRYLQLDWGFQLKLSLFPNPRDREI